MGNSQAQFAALVEAYSADLYRFAVWLCRDRAVAEDLVQETYLRAWRGLAGLRSDDSAKAWLLTILRREHARHREQQRRDNVLDPSAFLESLPDGAENDAETVYLRQAMFALPEDYREPLLLQVIGGFSTEEIAHMTDLSPAAVLTRLFRARQKLRAELLRHASGKRNEGKKA